MPWGLQRFQETGRSHFATFSCYHRQQLFTADSAKRTFERALERVRRSFGLQVYAYVVMPEHIHLLVSEPERGLLADALKSLKQGVSRRLVGEAGAPFKPSFGLSGAVRQPDKVCLPLARAFLPSTRTQSPLVLRSRSRIDESCSIPNLPDVRITRA